VTRLYFPDEAALNDQDPVLSALPVRSRSATLIARHAASGEYRFDIRLQGEGETVFFDL
jgi:protocatechuate 3,4-dioxygenase, alpha subunit